jgi:hypothetical protein
MGRVARYSGGAGNWRRHSRKVQPMTHAISSPDTIPNEGHAPVCIWRDGVASVWSLDTGGLLFADSGDLAMVVLSPEDVSNGHTRGLLADGADISREWAGVMDIATTDTRALYELLVGEPWDVIGWTEAEAVKNLQQELSGTIEG